MSRFRIHSEVVGETSRFSRRFQTESKNFSIHLYYENSENVELTEIFSEMSRSLDEIFVNILNTIEDSDQIRIALRNVELEREIWLPFREKRHFNMDLLMNEIIKVSQSKNEFILNGLLEIEAIVVKVPVIGGKYDNGSFMNIDKWRKNSNKVVRIVGDGLCLARAIVVSRAHADGLRKEDWRRVRENTHNIQTDLANKLCEQAGLIPNEVGFSYASLEKFQTALGNDYQLIAVSPPKCIIFKGKYVEKQIFVQIIQNHADSLLSIRSFLGCNYFCKPCVKGFSSICSHRCEYTCKYCFTLNPCEETIRRDCEKCNRFFLSQKCYTNHLTNKVCNNYKYCKRCKKLYQGKKHECGMKKCYLCRKTVPQSFHECFIQPNDKNSIENEDSIPKIFIFYDFESFIEINDNNDRFHKPNLCCISVMCDYCWSKDLKKKIHQYCSFCTADEKVFSGVDTVKQFLTYIFCDLNVKLEKTRKNMNVKKPFRIKVIAHNAKSYDIHFIVKYCLENNFTPKDVVKKGSKILSLVLKHIQFIDSLSFLPMALKKLPSTFGIKNTEKGDFPHKFNKPENWFRIDNCLPDIKYYSVNQMKCDERMKFLDWYESNKNNTFDFQREIIKYCKNDVYILSHAFMMFRDQWIENFRIDCITRCITLPQAVMEIYKTKYLSEYQIAIIPRFGYERTRRQSYIANAWLDYMQTKRDYNILREYRIDSYVVDGFIPETKEILEFYGCIFHGCKRCFSSNRYKTFNPFSGQTMDNLYQTTIQREKYFIESQFKLTTIWECALKEMRHSCVNIDEYFVNHLRCFSAAKYTPSLEPRGAFYGGRVEAIKLYHEADIDEKIYYYDFTSLYPFVCKTGKFPIGHPKRITAFENTDISKYEGLVFCVILPPRDLFLPLLPSRIKNKLFFTLCYKCAQENSYFCDHSTEERSLCGVWTTLEIKKSIDMGYKIIRIFEIWHFDNITQLNSNEKGLFSEFINDCIKGKIEASDWPESNMSEEQKLSYIDLYKIKENIELEFNKIENNPGKRNTYKLAINSFWGKFGQNSTRINKTEYINNPERFFQILSDESLVVDDAYLIGDETIQVRYNKHTEFVEESNSSNVIIAAYVTAQARLHLYNIISKIGNRCFYFDTDSVIFSAKENEFIPNTGIYLGELTNEVATKDEPNAYITKFLSCGPKNYAFQVFYPNANKFDYVIKIKGLTLNFETNVLINFNSMKNLIDKYSQTYNCFISVPQTKFITTDFNDILTKNGAKTFKLVFDKRMLTENYKTLPFGYKSK